MDSFATAISMCLQHGVPLKLLCEKFAHTRFEPSGWTGNQEIGYAKSIMDYIFRWIQIRFLSGQQLDLFAGLGPQHAAPPSAESVPVAGTVSAPENTVSLAASAEAPSPVPPAAPAPRAYPTVPGAIADLVGTSDLSPQTILDREKRAQSGHVPLGDQDVFNNAPGMGSTTPPQGGIAPDLAASNGLSSSPQSPVPSPLPKDRGVIGAPGSGSGDYHASTKLSEIVDLRDSPSCATCGAIMTRSGSCYRCMSCGNTSGCS
jgi:ribonucleoside-diphosphate reductase alpha chain